MGLASPPIRMLRLRLRHRSLIGPAHAAHSYTMTNAASPTATTEPDSLSPAGIDAAVLSVPAR
jgi:hypothetical protein